MIYNILSKIKKKLYISNLSLKLNAKTVFFTKQNCNYALKLQENKSLVSMIRLILVS